MGGISASRVRTVFGKELREYRRNRSLVAGMTIIPVVFVMTPLIQAFTADPADLQRYDWLLYMLGIPAVVPTVIAAYAVVGERQQGTLEPLLSTPVSPTELLLGKALAALVPSAIVSYGVFALVVGAIAGFAAPASAAALLRGSAILAQIVFTPLVAGWSIWLGLAISARARDLRVAQQLAIPVSLPSVAVAILVAVGVLPAIVATASVLGVVLVGLNILGWRISAAMFDPERLITE